MGVSHDGPCEHVHDYRPWIEGGEQRGTYCGCETPELPHVTWKLHHADLRDVLPTLADKSIDHVICDPPYSAHVHRSVRTARRTRLAGECRTRSVVDLGFGHLTAETRRFCAAQFARLTKRWILIFSDIES